MQIGVDPKVDYAFKRVFGHENNTDILCSLLNAVLNPPADQRLVSAQVLNPFLDQETDDDKLAILDIKARDQLGRLYNIEMQMRCLRFLRERILYYWAKLHGGQLPAGAEYEQLRPTISVLFLDQVLFPPLNGAHHRFRLWDDERQIIFTDQLELHLIELPKFDLPLEELTTDLDRWLFFLRHGSELDLTTWPAQLAESTLQHAAQELHMLTQDDIQRERYESRMKGLMDYRSEMKAERREGRQEGRLEGHQEGRQEGWLIGQIQLLQAFLHKEQTPADDLNQLSEESLRQIFSPLREAARNAGFQVP